MLHASEGSLARGNAMFTQGITQANIAQSRGYIPSSSWKLHSIPYCHPQAGSYIPFHTVVFKLEATFHLQADMGSEGAEAHWLESVASEEYHAGAKRTGRCQEQSPIANDEQYVPSIISFS